MSLIQMGQHVFCGGDGDGDGDDVDCDDGGDDDGDVEDLSSTEQLRQEE